MQDVQIDADGVIGASERETRYRRTLRRSGGIVTALNEATLNYMQTRKPFGAVTGTFQCRAPRRPADRPLHGAMASAMHCESKP